MTEEQLANLFRPAGEVIRFRIQFDPATGKTKGYGFCDFATAEGAQKAIQTLNGLEVSGRTLRVDSAVKDQTGGASRSSGSGGGAGLKQARDIESALAQLTVGEAYDILVEVKAWAKRDGDAVREVLSQRPVLAQALLKMQTCMGLVQTPPPADMSFASFLNPPSVSSANVQQQVSTAPGISPLVPPPPMNVYAPPAPLMPPQPYYSGPPNPMMSQLPSQMYPPSLLPHQQQGPLPPPMVDPEAYALLNQALSMSEEQIAAYPPPQQELFRQIRSSARR